MRRMWLRVFAVVCMVGLLFNTPGATTESEQGGGRDSVRIVEGTYNTQVFRSNVPFPFFRISLIVEEGRLIPAADTGFAREDSFFLSLQIDEALGNSLVRRRVGVILNQEEFATTESSAILRTRIVPGLVSVERCEDSGEGRVCGPGDLNDFHDLEVQFTWTWTPEDIATTPFRGFAGNPPNLYKSEGELRSILARGSGVVLGISAHGGGKVSQQESNITHPHGAQNPPRFSIPFDCAGCTTLRG